MLRKEGEAVRENRKSSHVPPGETSGWVTTGDNGLRRCRKG